ncbi:hypothetical protein [Halolamina pelagica]|uniref:hypothetical protein n=1 Tax=Halolamina pelagica TaxID=699431 RepID=UPI001EFA6512|nr:hypothetical protein [Halolamina pelagica]
MGELEQVVLEAVPDLAGLVVEEEQRVPQRAGDVGGLAGRRERDLVGLKSVSTVASVSPVSASR